LAIGAQVDDGEWLMDQEYSKAFDAYYYAHDCGSPYERNEQWLNFFGGIAERIVRDINPKTVLDAGCAMGFLVEGLRARGVEAWGVDVSDYAIGQVHESVRSFCRLGSITEPFEQKYDLITCIEIFEHMPASEAEKAAENLCRSTNDILFSSTPFDYKEVTHVNVHPPEHWAAMFARHGFYRDFEFDASFLTPWAVRFTRKPFEQGRFISEYERRFFLISKENSDLRALVQQQQRTVGKMEGEVHQQQTETAEVKAQLQEIRESRAWRFMSGLQKIRLFFIPRGSKAEQVLLKKGK
jgi:SAM-dependent methyltransferase